MAQYKKTPNGVNQIFTGIITNKIISEGNIGRIIPIMFSPDSLSDSMSLTANQTNIPGGPFPIVTYGSTGARQVSLSLTIPADYLPPSSGYNTTEEYLQAFRALLYPEYNASAVISPNCSLSLPNLYIDGICTSCNIDYKTDRYVNNGALTAQVSLTIMEVKNNQKVSGAISFAKEAKQLNDIGRITPITNTVPRTTNYERRQSNSYSDVVLTLIGNANYSTGFKLVDNKYVPDFTDPGFRINNNNFSVVTLYGYSDYLIQFSPMNIVVKNGQYLVNINGQTIYFNRGIQKSISTVNPGESKYYYYVYIPYYNNTDYLWNKAKMRTLYVRGGN